MNLVILEGTLYGKPIIVEPYLYKDGMLIGVCKYTNGREIFGGYGIEYNYSKSLKANFEDLKNNWVKRIEAEKPYKFLSLTKK